MPQTKTRKKGSRGGGSTKSRSSSRGASNGRTKATKKAVKKATKAPAKAVQGGGAVTGLLSKAKTPVIAGGAALAGLAGGMAIKQRNGRKGPSMSKALMSTAKAIGKTGIKAGELTDEIRKVREQVK